MRAATRHRRFQLSMQAWFCVHWLFREGSDRGVIDETVKEYEQLAGWRGRKFRV